MKRQLAGRLDCCWRLPCRPGATEWISVLRRRRRGVGRRPGRHGRCALASPRRMSRPAARHGRPTVDGRRPGSARRPGVRGCRHDRGRFHRRRAFRRSSPRCRLFKATEGDRRRHRRHRSGSPGVGAWAVTCSRPVTERTCASTFSISTCRKTGSRCARPSRATRRGCWSCGPATAFEDRHRARPARPARARRCCWSSTTPRSSRRS